MLKYKSLQLVPSITRQGNIKFFEKYEKTNIAIALGVSISFAHATHIRGGYITYRLLEKDLYEFTALMLLVSLPMRK